MDNINNYATLHIVTNTKDTIILKDKIREELREHNINHVTIEIEGINEKCKYERCEMKTEFSRAHHHHH